MLFVLDCSQFDKTEAKRLKSVRGKSGRMSKGATVVSERKTSRFVAITLFCDATSVVSSLSLVILVFYAWKVRYVLYQLA